MRFSKIVLIFIIVYSKAFGQIDKKYNDTINVYSIGVYDDRGNWKDVQKVLVKDLLRNPKKYNRKIVSVYGYVSLSLTEATKIYSSEESFKSQNNKDAILCAQNREDIYVEMRKFKEGYAIITGLFSLIDGDKKQQIIYNIRRIDIPK